MQRRRELRVAQVRDLGEHLAGVLVLQCFEFPPIRERVTDSGGPVGAVGRARVDGDHAVTGVA
jgi:hypothetical protein